MSKPGTKIGRWYRNRRWADKSRRQLQQQPLCCMCEEHGVVTLADVADHVVPHHGDEQLFWFGELQSLCYSHHNSTKQQIENKGYVNDIGVDGWPVDSKHPFNIAGRRE